MTDKIPVYIGTGPELKIDDPQIGIMEDIHTEGNRILGKLKIDDSEEGKKIKELIERGVTVSIVAKYQEGDQ